MKCQFSNFFSFRMAIHYFLGLPTASYKVRKPRITKLGQGVRSYSRAFEVRAGCLKLGHNTLFTFFTYLYSYLINLSEKNAMTLKTFKKRYID